MTSDEHARAFVLSLLGPPDASVRTPEPDDDEAWDEALRLIRYHMLEGLAVSRAERELPARVQEELEPVHRRIGMHTTLLLESWERARSALVEAEVPCLLYKGGALVASGAYPKPGGRRMDDVDVLVPPDRAADAMDALREGGFRPWTEWEPGKATWADATALDDPASPPGMPLVVDLHWRADYGRLRFGDPGAEGLLWEGADRARGLPAPEPHLVVVVEHLLKHLRFKVHLVGLADLALLAERVRDWDRAVALLEGRRLSRAAAALLDAARDELGLPLPRRISEALGAEGVVARAVRRRIRPSALLGRRRPVDGRLQGVLFRWLLAGTPGRVVGDLIAALFPGRRWLRARYAGDGSGAGDREASATATADHPVEVPGPWTTLRLWLRYVGDVLGWLTYRRRSPASPHESLFDPKEPT